MVLEDLLKLVSDLSETQYDVKLKNLKIMDKISSGKTLLDGVITYTIFIPKEKVEKLQNLPDKVIAYLTERGVVIL